MKQREVQGFLQSALSRRQSGHKPVRAGSESQCLALREKPLQTTIAMPFLHGPPKPRWAGAYAQHWSQRACQYGVGIQWAATIHLSPRQPTSTPDKASDGHKTFMGCDGRDSLGTAFNAQNPTLTLDGETGREGAVKSALPFCPRQRSHHVGHHREKITLLTRALPARWLQGVEPAAPNYTHVGNIMASGTTGAPPASAILHPLPLSQS